MFKEGLPCDTTHDGGPKPLLLCKYMTYDTADGISRVRNALSRESDGERMADNMAGNDLRKLSRKELLEIMVSQGEEIERLQQLLSDANKKLEAREIEIKEAGSIAEAALRLNNVFQDADAAGKQYLNSIKKMLLQEQDTLLKIQMKERELQAALDRVNQEDGKEQDTSPLSSGGEE